MTDPRRATRPAATTAIARSFFRRDMMVAVGVAVIVLLLVWALLDHVTTRLDPVTGDEPFYLVTAGSILRDGDINEANNWRQRDVDQWLPPNPLPRDWQGWDNPARGFPPHASQTNQPGVYSKHGLGVPALIVVPMALGGRTGIVLFYGLIGGLVAANMYLLARQAGAAMPVALVVTGLLAFSTPLLPYSFLIFPELPAALCTVYVFRRLLERESAGWQALLMGLSLGLLPWLHARLAIIVVALMVMALARLLTGRTRLPLVAFLAPALLSGAGLTAFYWHFYGRPWPNTQDHAGMTDSLAGWGRGMAGLLLDQQWGLLVHAPIYALAGAGIVALAARRRGLLAWLALVVLPYYLFVAGYNQWWGEWCPPARYLATLAPLMAAPIGALLAVGRTWLMAPLTAALGALSLAVSALFMRDPQLMYNHPSGQSALLRSLREAGTIDLLGALPSYVAPAATPDAVSLWWLVGAVTLLSIGALIRPAGRRHGGLRARRD